ncbi:hypothetical protein, partial [Enterococcus faecalis]|uniref:hypothetical protein n=1 Tax=Enterococcus faecalis TaxID=1351 RepID=UPI003D115842
YKKMVKLTGALFNHHVVHFSVALNTNEKTLVNSMKSSNNPLLNSMKVANLRMLLPLNMALPYPLSPVG